MMPTLVIKSNHRLTRDPCTLCYQPTDPCGIDLFLDGTTDLVCDDCARPHAPKLHALKREVDYVFWDSGSCGHCIRQPTYRDDQGSLWCDYHGPRARELLFGGE